MEVEELVEVETEKSAGAAIRGENGLPEGWDIKKLGDLIDKTGVFCDGDWIESKDQDKNGDVRLIQLADIGDGFFRDKSDRFLTSQKAEELKCTFLKEGDILVARMPEPLGRSCIFPLKGENKYVTVVDVCIIRPDEKLADKKFLSYLINSPQIRNAISDLESGTTRKRISRKNLNTIDFPIPHISEQQKIVSKIEELFSELDKGKQQLETAREQLKIYRQSVLKWAFEGKLTNAELKDGELPEGWKWVKVSEIGKIETGSTPSKQNPDFYSNDYPFYKPTDLEAGYNVRNASDNLSELGIKQARFLPENSVLVTCIGATIGKTGIIRRAGASNQQINAIIPSKEFNPNFIYYQTIAPLFQESIKDNAAATTLPILNKSKFQNLNMVIPHISEQDKIVEEIESRLSVADKVEETISQSLQQAETLRQSILKQAFEGNLIN